MEMSNCLSQRFMNWRPEIQLYFGPPVEMSGLEVCHFILDPFYLGIVDNDLNLHPDANFPF